MFLKKFAFEISGTVGYLFCTFIAIVELANSEKDKIIAAIVVTKTSGSYGKLPYKTKVPIYRMPAFAFLYLLGHAEEKGYKK